VRRALIELADDGVLTRIRGRGTFVAGATRVAAPAGLRIAVVSPMDISQRRATAFYQRLVQGMLGAAIEADAFIAVRRATAPYADFAATLAAEPGLRAIAIAGTIEAELIRAIAALGRAVVLVDSVPVPGLALDEINHDDEPGACDAVAELLRLGHRRIAALMPPPASAFFAARLAGYRRAHAEAGVAVDEALVRQDIWQSSHDGYAAARAVLAGHRGVTAFFAPTDDIAIGAIAAVRDAGRSVPADISIVGFGDVGAFSSPALSTVRMPIERLGGDAIRALVRRVAEPHAPPIRTILGCEWIPRASTAFAPARPLA
jgi:DNA-binding LacI/PurR family transcriptional regulator